MKKVEIIKKFRIFAEERCHFPTKMALSVIDSAVMRYAPASGIWLYSADSEYLTFSRLSLSLSKTLSHYPQLCGQLEWDDVPQKKLALRWGLSSDPGVALAYATCSKSLAEEFPNYDQRAEKRSWTVDQPELLNSAGNEPLALQCGMFSDWTGLPNCVIQLTEFSCGGFAISVKFLHCLADAATIGRFMRIWSLYNQDFEKSIPAQDLPVFQPELLDQQGSLAPSNATQIVDALAMVRYDLWSANTSNAPAWIVEHLMPPPQCLPLQKSPGKPIPWHNLNPQSRCEARYLHFDQAEIVSFWNEAMQHAEPGTTISKLDALLAKIWNAVILSKKQTVFKLGPRESGSKDIQFHIAVMINSRPKLSLPSGFVGSPTAVADVSRSNQDEFTSTSSTANAIRSAVLDFTPTACQSLVKEMLTYESPARYWNAYLGHTGSIFSSWIRQGAYDCQFVPGVSPYFVDSMMPVIDGLIQITESGPAIDPNTGSPLSSSINAPDWTTPGATVSLSLEEEALKIALAHLGRA